MYNTSLLNLYPFQMAKAASNKTSTKKDLKYPEIEEEALQFILDSCETSISKYSRFLKVKITKTAHLSLSVEKLCCICLWFVLFIISNCRKVDQWIWT